MKNTTGHVYFHSTKNVEKISQHPLSRYREFGLAAESAAGHDVTGGHCDYFCDGSPFPSPSSVPSTRSGALR